MASSAIILTCTFVIFIALSALCSSSPLQSMNTRQNNPCNVNRLPGLVPVDDRQFTRIVHIIIEDRSSGIQLHCRGIHEKAAALSNLTISDFPFIQIHLQQGIRAYPISCNMAQNMSRQEITDCLLSSYEVLKNLSVSASVITSTDFPSNRSMLRYLDALSDLRDRVDRTLCSIASNGLSHFVHLDSANLEIGPVDIVSDVSRTLTQTQVARKIYQLSKALQYACSHRAIAGTLSHLLQYLPQESSYIEITD